MKIKDHHSNLEKSSKKVKIDGTTHTPKTKINLKDGSKVTLNKVFGNPNDPMMHITRQDGSSATMRLSNKASGQGGRPTKDKPIQQRSKRKQDPFIKVFNIKADQIVKDTQKGKIKTLEDLKNHPSYKDTVSGRLKNKLIGAFQKAGGDTSYKPVVKPEVKKKSAGSFAPEKLEKIKSGSFKAPGLSRGADGTIQIQEQLLIDKRTMSPRAFFQKYGKKMASGGIVNARNGAFIEVQNKFSDRMLPGKKRTTRIY